MLRLVLALDVLMRTSATFTTPSSTIAHVSFAVVLVAAASALLAGVLTRSVAAIVVAAWFGLATVRVIDPAGPAPLPWHLVGEAVVVVLTGPGAYAIDARRYGRREIAVPRSPSRPD